MKGWYRDSWKHSLAAKGIRTRRNALCGRVVGHTPQGIPITIKEPPAKGTVYPVAPQDVSASLKRFSKEDLQDLKEINFRNPGPEMTKQPYAWAQYARKDRRINVFSQKTDGKHLLDVEQELSDPVQARAYMKSYVLPHEASHHVNQHTLGLNQDSMIVEEARADALAAGYDPTKKGVVDRFIAGRRERFGPKGSI